MGPNRSSSKTNRFNGEQLIPYTEGFRVNKKLDISNFNVVGSYENRTCNLVITKFSIDDEGKYKCQYVENHITNSHVYKVLLKRPPTNLKIENETQNNTLQVEEGSMLQLVCSVHSGQPKEILQWITDTAVVKEGGQNGTITYRLNASSSDHMKIFICAAFKEALYHPITKQVRLDVLDPPAVSINTTESQKKITLKCQASGDPGTYKFADWDHQSVFGKHIRYIENTRNGTLVLEKHNYQNSGIYKCSVKNGIPDMNGELYQNELVMVNYKDDDFTSTLPYGYCWQIMGSIVGVVVLLCGYSHLFCSLKRGKTMSEILHINPDSNYDEVEALNYNNAIFDHPANDADINGDNVSSIIDNNQIMLRADIVSSDDSSSFKQSGDGYENPYQSINPCDNDMHHYSNIVSYNYQNTIIWPTCLSANTPKYLKIARDGVTNPWLVIYKRK
ncbi:NCAM [Mytilus coruscus]|uniref:NCAM n=1 Tax=Mytilus coruscus TaxID=42192 RepID=A0A6J8B4M3_MYTCO|nr:NCAM [Mytilus coruscus]